VTQSGSSYSTTCYVSHTVVCVSVCVLFTWIYMYYAKMAKLIEMLFGGRLACIQGTMF